MLNNKLITDEECLKWHKNNFINPLTGRTILRNGAVYNTFKKRCIKTNQAQQLPKSPSKSIQEEPKKGIELQITKEHCIKWNLNKLKNPITNYTIKENKIVYNEFKRICEKLLKEDIKEIKEIKKDKEDIKEIKEINEIKEIKKDKEDIKEIKEIKEPNNYEQYYPDINDDNFREKLNNMYEFKMHTIKKIKDIETIDDYYKYSDIFCGPFEKAYYQYFIGHYISSRTPYKSVLIYHGVGVGKTCSAITIAESFLTTHTKYDEPKIWVIMPQALTEGFKQQIFTINKMTEQCTGDLYVNLLHINDNIPQDKINIKIKNLINSRYKLFTDNSFANFIEEEYIKKNRKVEDKIIIVDEAHNLRLNDNNEKKVYNTLIDVLKTGINNRLILLSATPMYNEPTDIFDLFNLLLINDKRSDLLPLPYPKIFNNNNIIINKDIELIKKLSSNYISYLRGKNPFSFALKIIPEQNGYEIIKKELPIDINKKPISINDHGWINKVSDGIIPVNLGEYQKEYLRNVKTDNDNIFNALQPMNIVYHTDLNLFTLFRVINENNKSNQLEYLNKYKNALMPNENNLGKYSGKFLKIANIIKKSKGIVIIYSRFIKCGILPIAIILEHLGFTREGSENILNKADIMENVEYDNIKYPKYCILTSETNKTFDIMGNSNFNNLINVINSPDNKNGELIKVILMTPVAGEGLSFNNTREIHLIEPWFHFNRVDQVIGRGIRNCSHKTMPITDRNVSIFMYGSINDNITETADIHAFKISSRKINQTRELDKIIRDNAIDCNIMKNINYFSKELFKKMGKLKINTSQGKRITVELGDDEEYEPKCNIEIDNNKIDYRGFRKETYNNISLNTTFKLKQLILKEIQKGNNYLTIKEIIEFFKEMEIDINIIMDAIQNAIYPNTLINEYTIIPHEDGLHIIKIQNNSPKKIRVLMDNSNNNNIQEDKKKDKINEINFKFTASELENMNKAIIALYSSIDYNTFNIIIKKIIENDKLNDTDEYIARCFYKTGALIGNIEIPSYKIKPSSKYIGYVNIFNEDFEGMLYNPDTKTYKDLTRIQKAELINNRTIIEIPNMNNELSEWGLYVPTSLDKNDTNKNNVFKILTAGISHGKKTGFSCTSMKKDEQSRILNNLLKTKEINKNTKKTFCISIATGLLNLDRLTLYPMYKSKLIIT